MKFINWLARYIARGQAAHPLNPPCVKRLCRSNPEDMGKTILFLNLTAVICVITWIWAKEWEEKQAEDLSTKIRDIGANLPAPDFSGLRAVVDEMDTRESPVAQQFNRLFGEGGRAQAATRLSRPGQYRPEP